MSFSNQLLFDDIRIAFNEGHISEGVLPNDHPLMEGEVENLKAFAKLIGVNFEETVSTYRLGKSGFINSPELKAFNDEPVIEWGSVRKPLSELLEVENITVTLGFKEKLQKDKGSNFYLTVESDDLNPDGKPVHSYYFGVACDAFTPTNLITKAFEGFKYPKSPAKKLESQKALVGFLQQRSKSMGNLPVGTYTVVWFGDKSTYGYSIKLDTGEKVYSNTTLTNTLRNLVSNEVLDPNSGKYIPNSEPSEILDPQTGKLVANPKAPSITKDRPAILTVTGHGTYKNDKTGKVSPTCKFEFKTAASRERLEKSKVYKVAKVSTIDQTEFEFPEAEDHSVATLEPVEAQVLTPSTGIGDIDDIAF